MGTQRGQGNGWRLVVCSLWVLGTARQLARPQRGYFIAEAMKSRRGGRGERD